MMDDSKRKPPPCKICHHAWSFHRGEGKCRAYGCVSCEQYVPLEEGK